MISRMLYVGSWKVEVIFSEDEYDSDYVLDCLYDLGSPKGIIRRTEEMMLSGDLNTGFTYTDSDKHRALIVIGPTSSGEEFINTLTHEVHHLAVAIADELGVDLYGEVPAYIVGDSVRELAGLICDFGCSRCND